MQFNPQQGEALPGDTTMTPSNSELSSPATSGSHASRINRQRRALSYWLGWLKWLSRGDWAATTQMKIRKNMAIQEIPKATLPVGKSNEGRTTNGPDSSEMKVRSPQQPWPAEVAAEGVAWVVKTGVVNSNCICVTSCRNEACNYEYFFLNLLGCVGSFIHRLVYYG